MASVPNSVFNSRGAAKGRLPSWKGYEAIKLLGYEAIRLLPYGREYGILGGKPWKFFAVYLMPFCCVTFPVMQQYNQHKFPIFKQQSLRQGL